MDSLRLKNFRCLEDTGMVDFAPLNILVGANSSGKSSFLKFFYLLKQTIRENRRGVFLWNSQNANSVDFRDFSNTVKDGEGSIGVEFIVKELPIYGFSGRTSTVVDQVKVSLVISKLDQYFDYLEQLVIEFADQKIECSYDTKRNSVVIVNGTTMSFKSERRLMCHTNSLLPTFRFVSTENNDDECSYAAKEEMRSILPENEMKYRSLFRLVRKKFMSKDGFRKRLFTEFETLDNWEELNNLYLYYTLNSVY